MKLFCALILLKPLAGKSSISIVAFKTHVSVDRTIIFWLKFYVDLKQLVKKRW